MNDLAKLIEAVNQDNLEMVKIMLDTNKQLVRQKDRTGATALHYAALNGHQQMAGLLIEQGAEINSRDDKFGATPAGWAIEHLREKGAYPAIELADLAYAIQLEDAKWVARFLERFPGLRTANDPDGISFQQLARASGNRAIIKLFE